MKNRKLKNVEGAVNSNILTKNQKGITLIALIITIIILLILAMVSINLVINGGIIDKAKYAVDKYKTEEEKEQAELEKWFGEEAELKKMILGEDLKGRTIEDISELLNNGKIEELGTNFQLYQENDILPHMAVYIKYNNKAYRILIDVNNEMTKSVDKVYEPKGKEGQKIEYSYDGSEANKKEWTILYDNEDNYEIISPEQIGNLEAGYGNAQTVGNNDFEKGVHFYNNSIEIFNNYANSIVTNSNKLRVRCVGSDPHDPNSRNTEKYVSDEIASWNCSYNGTPVTINGVIEKGDNNYEQDYVRMCYWKVDDIGEGFLLNSRCYYINEGTISCGQRLARTSDFETGLLRADSEGNTDIISGEIPVRPVVKIEATK